MNTTTKTIALAALLLLTGRQAAFSFAFQADTTKTDTICHKTDTVCHKTDSAKVEKKHECCQDSTVEDHKDPYHKVIKEGGSVREGLISPRSAFSS